MEILGTDKVSQCIGRFVSFPVQSTINRFLSSLKVVVAREIADFNFDLLMKLRGKFKGWKSIGWEIGTGECDYVFEKDASLRMVVVRQRVKKGNRARKQLKLLHTADVIYDYQVILANSDSRTVRV